MAAGDPFLLHPACFVIGSGDTEGTDKFTFTKTLDASKNVTREPGQPVRVGHRGSEYYITPESEAGVVEFKLTFLNGSGAADLADQLRVGLAALTKVPVQWMPEGVGTGKKIQEWESVTYIGKNEVGSGAWDSVDPLRTEHTFRGTFFVEPETEVQA